MQSVSLAKSYTSFMLETSDAEETVVPDLCTFIDDWRPRTFDIEELEVEEINTVGSIGDRMDRKWNKAWKRK